MLWTFKSKFIVSDVEKSVKVEQCSEKGVKQLNSINFKIISGLQFNVSQPDWTNTFQHCNTKWIEKEYSGFSQ